MSEKQNSQRRIHRIETELAHHQTHLKSLEQAETLDQQALAIRQNQLGKHHPDTTSNLNNLGMLYELQGHYGEAETLLQEALTIREQQLQLGADHTDTANSLNNLAMLYTKQGRYEEAKLFLSRALQIYEQCLGKNHPDTINVCKGLDLLRELS